MQDMIKLAIADDHTLFRRTLADFLSRQPTFRIEINAQDFTDLRNQLKSTTVDVLLTDIFMPDSSGIEALKLIRNEQPELKIVVLTMSTDLKLVDELLDIGIYAFISKAEEAENLVDAIKAAHNDQIYRNRLMTDALYLHTEKNLDMNGDGIQAMLDGREKKVLQLLWQEKSNKDIAKEIFLSVRSVEKIRQDIKQKLGIKSIVGLLKYALSHDIIQTREVYVFDSFEHRRSSMSA
jgi:DNA-binding NarL/FixJ family response regulator